MSLAVDHNPVEARGREKWVERLALLFRLAVAGLLLVAAGLRLHDAYGAALGSQSAAVVAFIIAGEIAAATLLIFNPFPRIIKQVIVLMFLVFAGYNILRISQGYVTCGCFDPIPVTPQVMLVVDVAIAVIMATSPVARTHAGHSTELRVLIAAIVAWLILLLAALAPLSVGERGEDFSASLETVRADRATRLTPEK